MSQLGLECGCESDRFIVDVLEGFRLSVQTRNRSRGRTVYLGIPYCAWTRNGKGERGQVGIGLCLFLDEICHSRVRFVVLGSEFCCFSQCADKVVGGQFRHEFRRRPVTAERISSWYLVVQ